MTEDAGSRLQPARGVSSPSTSPGLLSGETRQLPLDLVEKAVGRLGWVGAVYAATYLILYLIDSYAHRGNPAVEPHLDFFTRSMVVGVALGLAVFALARSRKLPPRLMLDLGLLFEVAGALMIAIAETCMPIGPAYEIRGHSAVAVWVVFFVLVVPTSTAKAALASFTAAAMGPLGMMLNIAWNGVPVPTLGQWLLLFSANFLMAFWSVLLSRYVYNLGAQMGRAKEMGSYELVELIGKGGMGEVWRARHRMLVRSAAIKLISPEALCCDSAEQIEAARRRFEREAQATAALSSPHTVALHDYGVSREGTFYYVMELLNGVDLETLIERFGPQPASRVIHLIQQVCESLSEAHAAGLTHRDIKPRNIYTCRLGMQYDFVKVLDFGLVKVRGGGGDTRLTQDGLTTGTPAYMSPEMAMGHHDVDARTDIYAVGCVAYWLLTGHLVFEASTPLAMALEHVQSKPVPPSERTEMEVPPELERVILQCLEKDPKARPQSARELSRMLASCRTSEPWDRERAEQWWRIHVPAVSGGVPASLVAAH
ncbi:MAG: serine/threonine protein kinase [Acidimicrobiia bacterium]|nr:serine/threonine protein kinase [Acidimicrobiia bacterium]